MSRLHNIPVSLRSKDGETAYQIAKQLAETVPLDQEPHVLDYKHWYLIKNRFPYDTAFCEHDMLLPRRGDEIPNRQDLNASELIELQAILEELAISYDLVFENFKHRRSVHGIYHLHLARYHKTREDMKL